MDDSALEEVLREIAGETHVPPERVVHLAKARTRGRRLVQVVSALSLLAQLFAFGAAVILLSAPELDPKARIAGMVALCAYAGCAIVALVAARERLKPFLRDLERLAA
jgi:ABC-type uncharacterized transport system permease subunit